MEKIPVLKLGEVLLVSIQVDINDKLALALQDDLSDMISNTGAKGVLIDISALDIVDSFYGKSINGNCNNGGNIGSKNSYSWNAACCRYTLVELGLSLKGMSTALNVEKGMKLLNADVKSGIIMNLTVQRTETIEIKSEQDVVIVRQLSKS